MDLMKYVDTFGVEILGNPPNMPSIRGLDLDEWTASGKPQLTNLREIRTTLVQFYYFREAQYMIVVQDSDHSEHFEHFEHFEIYMGNRNNFRLYCSIEIQRDWSDCHVARLDEPYHIWKTKLIVQDWELERIYVLLSMHEEDYKSMLKAVNKMYTIATLSDICYKEAVNGWSMYTFKTFNKSTPPSDLINEYRIPWKIRANDLIQVYIHGRKTHLLCHHVKAYVPDDVPLCNIWRDAFDIKKEATKYIYFGVNFPDNRPKLNQIGVVKS